MKQSSPNLVFGSLGLVILAGLIWYGVNLSTNPVQPQLNHTTTNALVGNNTNNQSSDQTNQLPTKVLISDVPFTSQAPTADWKDDRQQNNCEEASVLIATKWFQDKTIGTKTETLAELLTLSQLAESLLGTYVDSSASDTLKLFQSYANTTLGTVKYDVTLTDIKTELAKGHILLSPMDGRKLNNPNFTAGGPDRHFLVIIGYDDKSGMFTTNDPGTRNGKNYRYSYDTLINAMRDYPTGDHKEIFGNRRVIIIISKV